MPESNKAAKRRVQKANREQGIGDKDGRLMRVKEPPKTCLCTVCQQEMTITKTNTELTMHCTSKHGKTLDECFPGATAISEEMKAGGKTKKSDTGKPAAAPKKKAAKGSLDMLDDALSGGALKKKGKK
jgi:hypothetical protein